MTTRPDSVQQAERAAKAGDPEDVHALLAHIKRDHDSHQTETLTALARLDEPQLWRDLLGYLASNTWRGQHMPIARTGITHDIHRLFVQPFGQPMHNRRAAVREALQQPSARLRSLAATLAAEMHDREAVPVAVALLHDPHPEVRIAAARLIAAVPEPSAVGALLHNMEERDYGVRSAAVAAMRAIGRPALQALLRRLIAQPCGADFRMAAGHALHWLALGADPVLVGSLAKALRSPAPGVAVPVAADTLLQWSRQHSEAMLTM